MNRYSALISVLDERDSKPKAYKKYLEEQGCKNVTFMRRDEKTFLIFWEE